MVPSRKASVSWTEVGEESVGQRIDNFLLGHLKGVPKSHIYRILRSGEVRVNSGRVDATYRLRWGDRVRIPPVRTAPAAPVGAPKQCKPVLGGFVIHEDESLLALNKPAGWAVHGGSGVSRGIIEQLRAERPQARFLELVHRLDRETSGILLVAKKRSALVALHALLRSHEVDKRYLALVKGRFPDEKRVVRQALTRYLTEAGERRVAVDSEGKTAETQFFRVRRFQEATLMQARLLTGRTHQIRVHLAHLGFPIAGDDKYGDFAWNKTLAKAGLKRMFLHAASLSFVHPTLGEPLSLEAPLPEDLQAYLDSLHPLESA
ncbi:MAG: RluA family pseudouridine synthase [Betaproteobacteria bacterium]|nr:RluA family pseudouridine synthase [Betaproteobacteria bacterium]MDE2212541.1 RluA family pseudouridine synthase [Betaproteobacteria bacterium]